MMLRWRDRAGRQMTSASGTLSPSREADLQQGVNRRWLRGHGRWCGREDGLGADTRKRVRADQSREGVSLRRDSGEVSAEGRERDQNRRRWRCEDELCAGMGWRRSGRK